MKKKFTLQNIFICVILAALLAGLYVQNNSSFVWAIGEDEGWGESALDYAGNEGSTESTESSAAPVYTPDDGSKAADTICFDLSAGDISITETGASGYIFSDGNLTPITTDSIEGKNFYIYQSNESDYGTTSNRIKISADITVVFDSLSSGYEGDAADGPVYIDADSGQNITIELKGENRFRNIFYTNKDGSGSLTIKSGTDSDTLTLTPDSSAGVTTAIGASGQETYGLNIQNANVFIIENETETKEETKTEEDCPHTEWLFYTVSKDEITETCLNCGVHKATATISAENCDYDGNTHPAEVTCSKNWLGGELTPLYSMKEDEKWDSDENDTALLDWLLDPTPLHAGNYTASITIRGSDDTAVTAAVSYTINRIEWDSAEDRDHTGSGLSKSISKSLENNITVVFDVEKGIEVEARECADAISFSASAMEGYYLYNYTPQATVEVPGKEAENAVIVIEREGENSFLNIITGLFDEAYSGATVTVTLRGACPDPSVSAKYTDGKKTDDFEGRDLPISCDYAFTAAFEVQNYNPSAYSSLAVRSDTALPAGTKITLIYEKHKSKTTLTEQAEEFQVEEDISSDSFLLFFIIDFSKVAPEDRIGAKEGAVLSLDLVMTPAETVTGQAPELPSDHGHDLTVSLVPADTYNIAASSDNSDSATLTLFHENSNGAKGTKKEEGTELILTPETDLPGDLHIIFTADEKETTCYQNKEGQYVLKLNSDETRVVGVRLESVLFPESLTDYSFKAMWGGAECGLYFSHEPDPVPSLRADGINLFGFVEKNRIFSREDTLKLRLKYLDLGADCSIKCELLRSAGDGSYTSTGFAKTVADFGRLKDDGKINLDFTFRYLTDDCYCLMFTVTEYDPETAGLSQILTVPYYFILDTK